MGWSSHLISIIKAWEYTEWRQRKLEKQMGATCDLIVRTENIALGLPQTSLYRRRTPAAEGAGPRWCVAPLLPWGKDNFPGCPKPQQLLLLLAAPTGLHITQASDLSSGPTSYRDALRFAPAHSLLLKHGCTGILHGLKPTLPWLSCLQAFANSGLLLEEAMMRPVGMGIKQGLSVQGSIV